MRAKALRLLVIAGFAAIVLVLLESRGQWFSDLERQARVGREAIFSDVIDVGSPGTFTWEVPRKNWPYEEGEAELGLVVRWANCADPAAASKHEPNLHVRVAAVGRPDSGGEYDRVVRNWYFRKEDPFAPDAGVWRSFSADDAEYGLAGIAIYPFEKTEITVTVTHPDPVLATCKPRLKLVGKHDYAVYGHLPLLRLLRDSAIGVAIAAALGLAALAWRGASGVADKNETGGPSSES